MGLGILQDMTLAVKYFSLSAQQGQISAQYHLALCYEKGMGVQENLQEALHWYEKAAAVSFMHTKDE
jgi:TPR repeat protein